ncbi:MAG: DsbA family protein [Clostridium sp.]|nr:DsbA family protein [Clostridium sp.]
MKKIIITNFTDPVCSWCWGSEPVLRALETHYPKQIEFRYIMGGLVDDIDNFTDPANGITGGSDGANAEIMSHWLEGTNLHGMPINPEGFNLFSKEYPSTYPQNIAYKAAQIVDSEKADAFLRRLREATFTEAKITSDKDIQIELASEVGIDMGGFIKALNSGEAEKKFKADQAIGQSVGVAGFPSFLVKSDEGRQILLRGYKTLAEFKEIISYLSDGALTPVKVKPSIELLNELLEKHPKLALEEIRQALGFSNKKDTEIWLETYLKEGSLIKETLGNSYFIKKTPSLACDMTTGIC